MKLRLLVIAILLLGACSKKTVSLEGRPCESASDCLDGYVCNSVERVCVAAASSCADADGDGYGVGPGCSGSDCDDADGACATDCTTDSDLDQVRDCDDPCLDGDGDGYGVGAGCDGADCNDAAVGCNVDCSADVDADGIDDCEDPCIDVDGDGYGVGSDCLGPDCDDAVASCNADCDTDTDGDSARDCDDPCIDVDGDGYGVGSDCLGPDCDDAVASCDTDCTTDTDGDGARDCDDPCVDVDGDGIGAAGYFTSGCAVTTIVDLDDGDSTTCADTDADGCDDCALGPWDPMNDGTDADGDGLCVSGAPGADCNDLFATCTTDCTTNSDAATEATMSVVVSASDAFPYLVPDCVEEFCGTDVDNSDISLDDNCALVYDKATLQAVISDTNSRVGHEHVLVGSVTVNAAFGTVTGAEGITLRSLPGTSITFDTIGTDYSAPILTLTGTGSVLDRLAIGQNGGKYADLVYITGSNNTVIDSSFDAFLDYAISINGATNTRVEGCEISNGNSGGAANRAGILLLGGADGTVLVDNLLHGNNMTAIQAQSTGTSTGTLVSHNRVIDNKAYGVVLYTSSTHKVRLVANVIARSGLAGVTLWNGPQDTTIDHNTIEGNQAEGVLFQGSSATRSCMRNNLVTNNNVAIGLSVSAGWDTGTNCTGPLTPDAGNFYYGNALYGNTSENSGAYTYPAGTFWQHNANPSYRSTTVTDATYLCLGGSNTLIDLANDLQDDLVLPLGDGTRFVGSKPDVGGREAGAGDCPP